MTSSVLNPLDWLGRLRHEEIKIVDMSHDDRFVIWAEAPGVDPERDIRITTRDGVMRLEIARNHQRHDTVRSEFHYGTFARTVLLPSGADESSVDASYDEGIVEISVPLGERSPAGHVTRVHPVRPVRPVRLGRAS